MTRKLHCAYIKYAIGLLAVVLAISSTAIAQVTTLYWNPTAGGSGTWDTSTTMWRDTWSSPPSVVWDNVSTAVFRGTATGTVTVTGTVTPTSILIGATGDSGNNYAFSGGQLAISGVAPNIIGVTNSSDTLTINSSISSSVNLFFNNNTGTTWTGGTSQSFGSGNLILTASNALSGTVNIGGYNQGSGALRITNSNALGAAAVEVNGNNTCTTHLDLDGSGGGLTISNLITIHGRSAGGSHGLNLAPEIVNFAGSNSITSNITLQSGGMDYIIQSDSGKLTLNSITNASGLGASDRYLYLQGAADGEVTGTIGLTGDVSTYHLIKEGSGTWIFSGSNSYNSDTTVNTGVLRLKNNNALPATAAAVTASGGTATGRIELDGSSSALNIAHAITLAGRSAATDAQLANYSGNNTISGDISLIQGGQNYLIQSNTDKLTLTNIKNNSTVTGTRFANFQGDIAVSGVIGGSTTTQNDISIIKVGSGTLTLSGTSTYTGGTTINSGTLTLKNTGVLGNTNVQVGSGAYFDVTDFSSGYTLPGTQQLLGTGTVKGDVILSGNARILPGADGTAGLLSFLNNLTLGSPTGGTVKFDLASDTSSANNDLVAVTGNLALPSGANTATVSINMLGSSLTTISPYKLFTYQGTSSGNIANMLLSGIGGTTRQTGSLSIDTGAKEVDLTVSGLPPVSLYWKGNLSGNWDLSTTNWTWVSNGSTDRYYDLDMPTFDNSGINKTVTVTAALNPGTVTVNSNSDYIFQGTGAIGGGTAMTLTKSGTGKLTIKNTGTNTYGGTTTINAGTLQVGDNTSGGGIGGTGNVVNNGALLYYRTDDSAISGSMSGSGSLEKKGAGKLTLSGSNSFTGATTISNGQVVMASTNALGPTNVSTAITISNSGSLDIGGNSLGTRPVSVKGSGTDGSGAIVSNSGANQLNALSSLTLAGDTTLGGSVRWDVRGTGATLTGNTYNLTKTGSNGIFLVDLGNTGLGNVVVNQGSLCIQGTTVLEDLTKTVTVNTGGAITFWQTPTANPINRALTLNGGAMGTRATDAGTTNVYGGSVTLTSSGGILDVANTTSVTVSGQIGGAGMLSKSGSGTAILISTANNWNGGTTINAGTLQIGNGGANGSLPDIGTISNNGTLLFNSNNNFTFSTAQITGSGGLTKNGTGTVTLAAANSFSGAVAIQGNGALRLKNADALGDAILSSTALSISGGTETSRLEFADDGGGGYTLTAKPLITLAGRQPSASPAPHINNLSGNNSFGDVLSGGGINCAVSGAQYIIQSDSGKLTFNGTFTDTLTTARSLILSGAGNGEIAGGGISFTGTSGSLGVIKAGSGIWTISASSNHNGSTLINAGTLALAGNGSIGSSPLINVLSGATFDVSAVTDGYKLYNGQTLSGSGNVKGDVNDEGGAIIAPGSSIGTLTFNGNLTLAGGTTGDTIDYEFGGSSGDLLDVKGNLTLSGTTDQETLINPIALGSLTTSSFRVASVTGTLSGTAIKVANSTRYTVTSSVTTGAAGKINLTASGSNASLIWSGTATPNNYWDLKNTTNWLNGSSADQFYASDVVTFNDSATNTTVNINSQVRPMSLTVNADQDYTFSGTGKIIGATGLTKTGTGTLNINNSNGNSYSGTTTVNAGTVVLSVYNTIGDNSPLQINGGTVRLAIANALGENNIAATTINGGTLDLNAQSAGSEPIFVQGTGVGGNGAIINTGANATFSGSVRYLTMQGDTTVGGNITLGTQDSGRFEIGRFTGAYLAGNGYTLTKTGSNNVWLLSIGYTNLGAVVINQGELTIQWDNDLTGTVLGTSTSLAPVTVNAGGQFGVWTLGTATPTGAVFNNPVTLNGGGIGGTQADTQTPLTFASSITMNGGGVIYASNEAANREVTFSGAFTGTGDLTKSGSFVTRSQVNYDRGTAIFSGTNSNTYNGATNVYGGRLILRKTAGAVAIPGNLNIGDAMNGASGVWDAVQLGASDQIADTSIVTFTASGANNFAYLDMMGYNETVGGINDSTGYGIIQVQDTSTVNSSSTLTVNNTANCSYNGIIRDKYAGAGTGTLVLVKDGAGKLTLGVSNISSGTPYSGGTTVKAGILSISDNSVLGSPSGKLTLNGGTLEATASFSLTTTGTAPVARPIEITASGGAIQVSADQTLTLPGTYTLNGGLTAKGGGTLSLALASAPTLSTSGPLSIVAGTTVTAGGAVDPFTDGTNGAIHAAVANDGKFAVTAGTKTTGNVTGTGETNVSGSGTTLSVSVVRQGHIYIGSGSKLIVRPASSAPLSDGLDLLPLTPVPEPSTWALLILAAMVLGVYRLRRR